jgi:hypothetical protein
VLAHDPLLGRTGLNRSRIPHVYDAACERRRRVQTVVAAKRVLALAALLLRLKVTDGSAHALIGTSVVRPALKDASAKSPTMPADEYFIQLPLLTSIYRKQ